MRRSAEIGRLHLADLVQPESSGAAGRVDPVYGFLIRHPEANVLVDSGVGDPHPVIDSRYRPRRYPLDAALAHFGLAPGDVDVVVNSHLHFDHCGGNRLLGHARLIVQRAEWEAAREPHYTVPEWVDFPGARYERVDGECELLPGLCLVPTPGHTGGHQSVSLETDAGLVVVAAQALYGPDEYADPEPGDPLGARSAPDAARYRASAEALRRLDPAEVHFSHHHGVWRRPQSTKAQSRR